MGRNAEQLGNELVFGVSERNPEVQTRYTNTQRDAARLAYVNAYNALITTYGNHQRMLVEASTAELAALEVLKDAFAAELGTQDEPLKKKYNKWLGQAGLKFEELIQKGERQRRHNEKLLDVFRSFVSHEVENT